MFRDRNPVYDFDICLFNGMPVLCIRDLYQSGNPTMTVTNGVELVLAQIVRSVGALPKLIIYRDSEGEWDRIKAKPDGTFNGFAPLAQGLDYRVTADREALEVAGLSFAAAQPETSDD